MVLLDTLAWLWTTHLSINTVITIIPSLANIALYNGKETEHIEYAKPTVTSVS